MSQNRISQYCFIILSFLFCLVLFSKVLSVYIYLFQMFIFKTNFNQFMSRNFYEKLKNKNVQNNQGKIFEKIPVG